MGRGSAPQGGAGNYGGSKSAKPRKPRNITRSFKVKNGSPDHPDEATAESSPAFTVTMPSRERRAELLRAQRREKAVAAELAARAAALARRPVNGTSPGGAVLGGDVVSASAQSSDSLREKRLQHFAKQQNQNCLAHSVEGNASASSSTLLASEPSTVMLSEDERRQTLEALLRQPIVESWQSRIETDNAEEDESDVDIRDDELRVLVSFLLDSLADRLGPEEVARRASLLKTVLGNVTKEDPKYRRLRSGNDKLWAGLLQHPEFCLVLEAAGFQKSTEEQDQHLELEQLELRVQDLLDGSEKVVEAKVEAVLRRMEELKNSPASTANAGEDAAISNNLAARSTTFVHPASAFLLGDLGVVLDAVAEWTPLSTEEVCPQVSTAVDP